MEEPKIKLFRRVFYERITKKPSSKKEVLEKRLRHMQTKNKLEVLKGKRGYYIYNVLLDVSGWRKKKK